MRDIYDIHPIIFGNIFSFSRILIFLGILFFLYLIYRYIHKPTSIHTEGDKEDREKIVYSEQLPDISDSDFLKKISSVFRIFLEQEKGYVKFSAMSLKEVLQQSNIKESYKQFLENIYFQEYKQEFLEQKEKEAILQQIHKLFN